MKKLNSNSHMLSKYYSSKDQDTDYVYNQNLNGDFMEGSNYDQPTVSPFLRSYGEMDSIKTFEISFYIPVL